MPDADHDPASLDATQLQLTGDILRLTESLAENQHERWMRQRTAQGWKFGPRLDEEQKEHPNLVPFEKLTETEKHAARNAALASMQAFLASDFSRRAQSDTGM